MDPQTLTNTDMCFSNANELTMQQKQDPAKSTGHSPSIGAEVMLHVMQKAWM